MSGKSSKRSILTEADETTELVFTSYGGADGLSDYGSGKLIFNHDSSADNRNFRMMVDSSEKLKIGKEQLTFSNGVVLCNDGIQIGRMTTTEATNENGVIIYDSATNNFLGRKEGSWVSLTGVGIGVTTTNPDQSNGVVLYDSTVNDFYGKVGS